MATRRIQIKPPSVSDSISRVFPDLFENHYQVKQYRMAIFCGPSISPAQATSICPFATAFPPITRGDLPKVIKQGYNVIAIIDGTYITRATLSAAEIYSALRKGVHLYGAASLGALRAVEFSGFGFQGFGTIYNWYKIGLTHRDDEVVVPMHPETFQALADPLVNLRFALHSALNKAIIQKEFADFALDIYQSYFYTERRFERLAQDLQAKIPSKLNQDFNSFLPFLKHAEEFNLKLRDSEQLLQMLSQTYWWNENATV